MDERLEKALEFSNYMITLSNQKRILGEQFNENVIYYFNGGEFTASPELMSFCQCLLFRSQTDTILIDNNGLPVEIENLQLFSDNIASIYYTASNKYLTEYNKLKKNRTVSGIIDL